MSRYPDGLTVREGRARYFASGGIPADGGYDDAWVRLQAGPIPLGFPNTPSRRRAVRLHDVHHVLTGYGTTWTGEAEISAWEISSGCGRYLAAWVINLHALFIGLLVAPARVYRAFLRGRGARNLYHGEPFSDALLDERLGDVRRRLAFDAPGRVPGMRDRLAWIGWTAAAFVQALATAALLTAPVVVVIRWVV
jgi:hypothetical protein